MSSKDHEYAHDVYRARGLHPSLRFLVMWCPVCHAHKDDDGLDQYCSLTDACVTVKGALRSATKMQRVEVATREGWNGL